MPPGPICIPSINSIDAVLNAVEHNYIFMCAKEDFSGYHNFAKTYSKHLINARKYQKALNRKELCVNFINLSKNIQMNKDIKFGLMEESYNR